MRCEIPLNSRGTCTYDNPPPHLDVIEAWSLPHQSVGVVAGEDEDVDGGGVVGDADAVLGHVLGVVVGYHSRYGAP